MMREQPDGFLQTSASYNFDRNKTTNYKHKKIASERFQQWTKQYMYETSYAHFHSKDSLEPKNTAIPGYAGYIPSIKAENICARGHSALAKLSFSQEKLGLSLNGLATTGYNLDRSALIDKSKIATSSKYGKSQIQRAYPGWSARWLSTAHQAYRNPRDLVDPTYRATDKYLQTTKLATKGSGYATNNDQLDGQGWKPDPVLRGDNTRTEYRDRYNADHPFHRDVNLSKLAKLPKKEYNYKFN